MKSLVESGLLKAGDAFPDIALSCVTLPESKSEKKVSFVCLCF